jgi:hypothetical protein
VYERRGAQTAPYLIRETKLPVRGYSVIAVINTNNKPVTLAFVKQGATTVTIRASEYEN